MQILFLNGLWRLLKNGHLPVKLHSSALPPWALISLELTVGQWLWLQIIRSMKLKIDTYTTALAFLVLRRLACYPYGAGFETALLLKFCSTPGFAKSDLLFGVRKILAKVKKIIAKVKTAKNSIRITRQKIWL